MKIMVTFEIDEDDPYADPDHPMGITNECFERLISTLPGYDVEVIKTDG